MQVNGDRVAGKKIELIVREDTGVPDVARRIVQEMIVNDKVNIVLGGITPTALAISPARHAGEDPDRGDHLGRVGHDRPLALHDAHQLHARPVVDDHGRLGGQERQQEGRDPRQRLGTGRGGRDRIRECVHGRRRRGDREAQSAARESGLRAVPAAHPRHRAGHGLHLLPRPAGRHLRAPVRRARARQGQHQAHRPGRPDRRRRACRGRAT